MFEFIAQQAAGIAAKIVATPVRTVDTDFTEDVSCHYPRTPEPESAPETTDAERAIAADYPAIARVRPGLLAKLARTDTDIRDGQRHPEVWLPGNALDYFASTGGIAVGNHRHVLPSLPGGWASLTNGRWISG